MLLLTLILDMGITDSLCLQKQEALGERKALQDDGQGSNLKGNFFGRQGIQLRSSKPGNN